MRRECPECSGKIGRNGSCVTCGWAANEREDAADPHHCRCSWVSDGDRCRFPGALSASTTGGGPWYCREHFGCGDMSQGAGIVRRSQEEVGDRVPYTAEAMRESARRAYQTAEIGPPIDGPNVDATVGQLVGVTRNKDPKRWARTILAEAERGRRFPSISITFAKMALGMQP